MLYLDFMLSIFRIGADKIFDLVKKIRKPRVKGNFCTQLSKDIVIQAFKNAAAARGHQTHLETLQPAPAIQLPSSWNGYLEQLDPRYKQEILRKIRNAETYFLPVDWYIVTGDHDLDQEMDAFLDLMADNHEKRNFLTEQMVNQMKASAQAAHQAGWLQLAFLTVGDIKAAGYLNFDYQGKILVYNSGINSVFENISPGWVLLSRIIEWSIDQGKVELDFMRGDEAYKYQFGGKDRHVLRLTITR